MLFFRFESTCKKFLFMLDLHAFHARPTIFLPQSLAVHSPCWLSIPLPIKSTRSNRFLASVVTPFEPDQSANRESGRRRRRRRQRFSKMPLDGHTAVADSSSSAIREEHVVAACVHTPLEASSPPAKLQHLQPALLSSSVLWTDERATMTTTTILSTVVVIAHFRHGRRNCIEHAAKQRAASRCPRDRKIVRSTGRDCSSFADRFSCLCEGELIEGRSFYSFFLFFFFHIVRNDS